MLPPAPRRLSGAQCTASPADLAACDRRLPDARCWLWTPASAGKEPADVHQIIDGREAAEPRSGAHDGLREGVWLVATRLERPRSWDCWGALA